MYSQSAISLYAQRTKRMRLSDIKQLPCQLLVCVRKMTIIVIFTTGYEAPVGSETMRDMSSHCRAISTKNAAAEISR